MLMFDQIGNFRDFGGYRAVDGNLVKGRLYRSAHHAGASQADLERLAELDLGAIIDLRSASERRRFPSRRPAGYAGRIVECAFPDHSAAPHLAALQHADGGEAGIRACNVEFYRELPFIDDYVVAFRQYFRLLRDSRDAVLIHCSAGKDRTGFLTALTQRLAGVHPDEIMEEYLLTNRLATSESSIADLMRTMTELTGHAPPAEAMAVLACVQAEYLSAAWDAITTAYGSVDDYLERALEIDKRSRRLILAQIVA
jgi:protein-tyrosine phosphatase